MTVQTNARNATEERRRKGSKEMMKKWAVVVLLAMAAFLCVGCQRQVTMGNGEEAVTGVARQIDCALCHGDGVCYHCDGMGFRNGRRCSVCNGNGACAHCNGKGALEVIEMNGRDYTVCGSCQGDGKCDLCNGTGRIQHSYASLGTVNGECTLCHGSGNCLSCHGSGLSEVRGF